jgi:IS5 family transposase
VERLTGQFPETAITDRGYRGKKKILATEIRIPGKLPAYATNYQKQKARKYFRAMAGIEPMIGHIKHDHRMIRNYLSGTQGDAINTILAATGFNLMKILRRIRAEVTNFCLRLFETVEYNLETKILICNGQGLFQV